MDKETTNIYKAQIYIKCTEEAAASLRKSLAQVVADGFKIKEQSTVFGATIEPYISLSGNEYVMALCIVELGDGLNANQIIQLVSILPENVKYMPIEFHGGNTSAYGFIRSDYYELHDYKNTFFELINEILEDMSMESPNGVYNTSDSKVFYMDYLNELSGGEHL